MKHEDELLTLAKFLWNIPKTITDRWDMDTWYEKHDWGTVRCAIGFLFVAVPETGLKLEVKPEYERFCGVPVFDNLRSWSAISAYFDMDRDQLEYIFCSNYYEKDPTPRQVATRIRNVVKFVNANI